MFFLYTKPFLKRIYYTPLDNNFFPFTVDTFKKGGKNNFYNVASPEAVPISRTVGFAMRRVSIGPH